MVTIALLIVCSLRLRRRRVVPRLALRAKKVLERKKRSLTTDLLQLVLENRPKTFLVSATSWPHSTIPSST